MVFPSPWSAKRRSPVGVSATIYARRANLCKGAQYQYMPSTPYPEAQFAQGLTWWLPPHEIPIYTRLLVSWYLPWKGSQKLVQCLDRRLYLCIPEILRHTEGAA